jgi:hypothetical protein
LHEKIVELRSHIVLLVADLKVPIPTSCSTRELHAMKNLELAQCVDHLQDEICKLREVLSWLSGQEPQLGMMIASCKCFDGWALGFDKVGESSGAREGKFGNVPVPPQSTPKDKFASKPNQLLKPSQKPSGKPSEKPCEEAHPKPKPRPIHFHCEFCGKDGHKREFCYKRRREVRMAKEWANKDRYHPSSGVLERRVQMPRAKAGVRTVPAWGERKAAGGVAGGVKLVRPIWSLQGGKFGFRAPEESRFVSGGRGSGGWSGEFAGGEFDGRSPPCDQYEFGRGRNFESQRGYVPCFPYRGSRTPPVRWEWFSHGGSRSYWFDRMERSFDRRGRMDVANPTFEEMARRWFDTFGTNPRLSHLLALALGFELQVGGLENIWLITGVVLRPQTSVVTWR